jgi:hypothetical protein
MTFNYIKMQGDQFNPTLNATINELADYETLHRVMQYGAEAENMIIVVLPLVLNVRTEIIVLTDGKDADRFVDRGGTYGNAGPLFHLLLKTEHYDILYARESALQ